MTHKQKTFLKELPKNNYNVRKAALKAGYTKNSANKNIYTYVKKARNYKAYFNEDNFYKSLKKIELALGKTEDYTNRLRLQELKSKILGLQIDKTQNQTEVIVKEEEKTEVNRLRNGILSTSIQ